MHNNIFEGIFNESTSVSIKPTQFLLCIGTALLIGLFLAVIYAIKTNYTKSFLITLAILPSVVCVVIMMVNGNVGAGVAVAGAFSLVRFRSAQGTAKEIATIFLAMGAGLMTGMGYLAYAILFTFIVSMVMLIYSLTSFGTGKKKMEKTLKITIPEDLNYTDLFDDLLSEYTISAEEVSVKTVNMGSLFKLTYNITLRDMSKEKEFIDALRCRNGNLEISLSPREVPEYGL